VIHETCSCGASFKTNEPEPVKLVREWRKNHVCAAAEGEVQAVYGSNAQVENAVGFTATGLNDPARSPYPEWDE